MRQASTVSRPSWMVTLSGGNGGRRRSPVEIVATAATYVTHNRAADLSGLRSGRFGLWADGVIALRGDCITFASHWDAHNDRAITEAGPLWVVLGDSTAQGLGAPSPMGGYVGQVLAGLQQRTGQRWRVLNLSLSGALIRDVLRDQLPRVPAGADHHLSGRRGSRPAGRRGIRPLPAAVDREVRLRQLPPQPGRLPRLGARAARRHPRGDRGRWRCRLMTQQTLGATIVISRKREDGGTGPEATWSCSTTRMSARSSAASGSASGSGRPARALPEDRLVPEPVLRL
jgi:hypothetical protein